MTRKGYDTDLLVEIIMGFGARHPHIEVILEPGSAFTWRTGDLAASVVDVVENDGISTAILDVSFACHMPDAGQKPGGDLPGSVETRTVTLGGADRKTPVSVSKLQLCKSDGTPAAGNTFA